MASALKNLSEYNEKNIPDASGKTIGIVLSEYNAHITHALYEGCFDTLLKHGLDEGDIHTLQVPGTYELPMGARMMLGAQKVDAVICLGCVIKGETKHDEYINQAVATGLIQLSLTAGKPVIFGVLTPNTEQQALDRAGGTHGNKGVEAAVSALRMIALKTELKDSSTRIGY